MELIKIDENRLKVMLTAEDLRTYDIAFDRLDYSGTETRRVIWSILDTAKKETGFDAAGDKICIRAFRDKDGGCELFVSRVTAPPRRTPKKHLYAFSTCEALCAACKRLSACRFEGAGAAYLCDDGRFFLELEFSAADTTEAMLSILLEFGKQIPHAKTYLAEHATTLCQNAVSIFARLI